MALTSFEMDERTFKAVQELQDVFGVKTNAAVFRKAVAISAALAKKATEDHTVTISGSGPPLTISLQG